MYRPVESKKRLMLLSAISGTGHSTAARALASILRRRFDVDITLVHRILGTFNHIGELVYNFCLVHRRIRWIAPFHRISKTLIRLYRPFLLASIKRYFERNRYDGIVSCIPWVNHYFLRALPDIPQITVITDFSDSETHPWIQHRKQRLICPTPKSVAQAQAFGIPQGNIVGVSGAVISTEYYKKRNETRHRHLELTRLGLDPELRTALVFYGGYGPNYMEKLVGLRDGWNFIVIWGNNKRRVRAERCFNVGYSHEIPFYMSLATLLVGKPGPGVISEAIHCDLPVFVDAEKHMLLPQEEEVLRWIVENDVGTRFRSYEEFDRMMSSMRERDLHRWRSNAKSIVNHAVFEASETIEQMLAE